MLFNSYEFILLFFPVCVLGYFACARFFSLQTALGFLVLASLAFYAYWNPAYLVLLLGSIGFNFLVGRGLSRGGYQGSRWLLTLGIAANLALLAWFKYANFFVDAINMAAGRQWDAGHILLPLAISFFTFQQIAFLVDAYRGETREDNFLHYSLFVCFFPQLIAGPVVRHKEIAPQFKRGENMNPQWTNIAIGLSIFAIGLFKKTVLADSLAGYVDPVFDSKLPREVDFFRAWGGSLAYTFQLYFDFSGYTDMAIGAARVFGVRLPLNFFSPYKSTSIIEFWRRWHMSLSRFVRDYLYISLGGNRGGQFQQYVLLLAIMLLVGLWHGANWTFVVWGGLHGGYLVINHAWRYLLGRRQRSRSWPCQALGWVVTFVALVFSWVYFRAPTLGHGNQIAQGMLGMSGFEVPAGILARLGGGSEILLSMGFESVLGGGGVMMTNFFWIVLCLLLVLLLPNVAQVFGRHEPVLYENDRIFGQEREALWISWSMNRRWAFVVVGAGVAGVLTLQRVSEFLYFQF